MTTVDDDAPNMPPSISFRASRASSIVGRINTPLPAARPSALRTYGASSSSRNFMPSSIVAGVKLR